MLPGGVAHWGYDNKGNVTITTDAAGQVTLYGYDGAGNQTSVTDANTHVTMFGYDQYGNRTERHRRAQPRNGVHLRHCRATHG